MSVIDDLEKIEKLKEQGILTEEEFDNEKNKILNKSTKVEENNIKTQKSDEKIIPNNNTEEQKIQRPNKSVKEYKKRVCKNCGNEILEGEKFCGKCGHKVDEKNIKTKQYIIIGIIAVVIIVATLLIILINNSKEQDDKVNENSNSTNSTYASSNQTNTSTEESSKEYYDFVDTLYGTFNIKEGELVRLLVGGSYSNKGYKQSLSQNDQYTRLYTKTVVDYSTSTSGVESISVTSPGNREVKEFNISFFSNNPLTNDQMIELSRGYLILGVAALKEIDVYEMTDTEKAELEQTGKDISEDKYKGLDYTCIRNTQKVQCIFKATF